MNETPFNKEPKNTPDTITVNPDDLSFNYIHINSDENPTLFFNWCLKHKLFKTVNKRHFVSHLKVLYENNLEAFLGCTATIAFYKNRPIGLCFLNHTNTKEPLNLNEKESYLKYTHKSNHLAIENKSDYYLHKAGFLFQDSRERKNPWKYEFDSYFLHLGFTMFYIKPKYRNNNIASQLLQHMEHCVSNNIQHNIDKNLFPKEFMKTLDKNMIITTSQELAFNIIQNKSSFIHPSNYKLSHNNYNRVISELSFNIHLDHQEEKKTIKNLLKKYPNPIEINPLVKHLLIPKEKPKKLKPI